MTRTLAASVNSYLSEPALEVRLLADVTFTNTTMRLHTGVGSMMVGATHYDGIGTFGGIERVTESPNNFVAPVTIWLSAVDSAGLSEAVTEKLFGKPVVLYRAWMREGAMVNTPEEWYRGVMGEVNIHRGDPERGNYIEVGVQSKLDRGRRPTYYTKEDLALTYSGDTFFNYTDQIPGMKALWGQKPTRFSNYAPIGNRRGRAGFRRT
jgi:hypothetical protein